MILVSTAACKDIRFWTVLNFTPHLVRRLRKAFGRISSPVKCSIIRTLANTELRAGSNEITKIFISALKDRDASVSAATCEVSRYLSAENLTLDLVRRLRERCERLDARVTCAILLVLEKTRLKVGSIEINEIFVSALKHGGADVFAAASETIPCLSTEKLASAILRRWSASEQ